VNKRIFQIAVAVFFLVGCTAAHYHERQSDRVIFYLNAPDAKGVVFANSLNAFSPQAARKTSRSCWTVSVAAKAEFSYFYIVDGVVHVPECKFYEKDDFGAYNCVYVPE
jgi:hypothetical protein